MNQTAKRDPITPPKSLVAKLRGGSGSRLSAPRIALWTIPLGLLSMVFNIPTLLRQSPPTDACGISQPFVLGAERFQNCDSPRFNRLALDFDWIFEDEGETRQGRPGYAALGWFFTRFLRMVTLGVYEPDSAMPPWYAQAEWGFLLLNIIVLGLTLSLTLALLSQAGKQSWGILILAGMFVVANPVTRAFFWTAHTQLFNLLIPPLTATLGILAFGRHRRSSLWFAIGLSLGLSLLVYGSFAVVLGVTVLALASQRDWRGSFAVVAGCITPVAAWILYVVTRTGGFYSVEADNYRQFVWIMDAVRDGTLVTATQGNLNWLALTFTDAQTVIAMVIAALLLMLVAGNYLISSGHVSYESQVPSISSDAVKAIALALPIEMLFLYAMGFYQTRLSWLFVMTFILGSLLISVIFMQRLRGAARLSVNVIAVGAAMLWYLSWITIPGPWH